MPRAKDSTLYWRGAGRPGRTARAWYPRPRCDLGVGRPICHNVRSLVHCIAQVAPGQDPDEVSVALAERAVHDAVNNAANAK